LFRVFPAKPKNRSVVLAERQDAGDLAQQGAHEGRVLGRRLGGGRLAAYEILVVTSGIANLIRENKTYRIPSSIQTGKKYGMQLLDEALFNLWKSGLCEERACVRRIT
jgi:Tfp pilus assembly pilus retraction ATPase PilT